MRNYTLYVKFNVLIVGTIFICGLLAASLFLYSTSEYMNRELDASGRELAVSIGQVISNDILVDDRFDMTEQLLHAQQTNRQVRYILVTYPDGRILASTFTEGLPKGLPERRDMGKDGLEQTLTFDSTEGYIREIIVPIDGGLVGYFRVGLSERPMMQLMWKRFVETMLIILAICLVASALATRYARAFLRPVQALAKAIRQIGRGNYSVRVSVDTKDDVGQLAKAFNVMSNRLAVKNRENSKLLTALREKGKESGLAHRPAVFGP
ncbi:HAMP domain-containing protein [uncultured Megasphaera sp.]|uniref:HAMP domain-containing protein n=1 Tax=uncultured Megasphaera sp. TaxID=165188 RepID=UPI0025E468BB|nr:HAMP domain-containing protein [uncultured Megasphaera sp.]